MTRTELIARLRGMSTGQRGHEVVREAADMLEADAVSPEQHYMNGFSEGTKRTNKLREAARLALDALRQASRAATDVDLLCACECAIAKIKEAGIK